METIFDGIQRPLKTIATVSKSVFVPRGVDVASLDQVKEWEFTPKNLKVGQLIVGGDMLGTVFENDLFSEHGIMVSPKVSGRVVEIMPKGMYNVSQPIAVLENNKGRFNVNMSHFWPVRNPRPVAEKLPGNNPLLTGQRVLDALFPTVQGGTCAIPGAFGCGKTCISQALSKYSPLLIRSCVYLALGEVGPPSSRGPSAPRGPLSDWGPRLHKDVLDR